MNESIDELVALDPSLMEPDAILCPHRAATLSVAAIIEPTRPLPDDLRPLVEQLRVQSTSEGEGVDLLRTQATVLDLLFNRLLQLAMNQSDATVMDSLLKLAFRAQAQCKANLTAVSDILHPRITNNIGQVNNSSGHQQVNNNGLTHGEKIGLSPNKLSEEQDNVTALDTRTTSAGEGADAKSAAMGEVHRTEDCQR